MNNYHIKSIEDDNKRTDTQTLRIIKENIIRTLREKRESLDFHEKHLELVEKELNNRN